MSDVRAETRRYALKLLARREHSRAELYARLARRGVGPDDACAVLDELAAEGLQSDRRFAEGLVRSRIGRGYGPVRILVELRRRGVVEHSLAGLLDWDETRWGEQVARVRLRQFGGGLPEDPAERARQVRFLQRRGFTDEQVRGLMGAEDG